MFRLFQIDPETGAIHVNVGAIERHQYSEALKAALDAFRSNRLAELVRTLFHLPESDERAHVVSFVSQLIHELRHATDLLLTPYGFHRIRIGFEFYEAFPHFLSENECKIFPFSSWLSPQMRDMLGGAGTENSFSYRMAHMSQNRRALIEADNRRHKHETGAMMSFGGDAILEALAFGFQVEWLQHPGFETDTLRNLMPYAFPERSGEADNEAELDQFDLTYRWHYPLMRMLSQEPTPATASLMYTILFASLCGSLTRDAKVYFVDRENVSPPPVGGRNVSDRLPSVRFEELLGWFGNYLERGGAVPDDPMESWKLVNDASRDLWQMSVVEEIGADIAADEALLDSWRALMPELFSIRPCAAFADLLAVRRALLVTLSSAPERILRPLGLAGVSDDLLAIPLSFFYPQGADSELSGSHKVIEKLIKLPPALEKRYRDDHELQQPEPDKILARQVLYSSWQMKTAMSLNFQPQGLEAWPTVLGEFAPAYKLALYGHRYRTILELDLYRARDRLSMGQSDIRWDDYFLDVDDISASWEYFHFYGLKEAQCDVCSRQTTADNSIIASSATMRTSESFVQSREERHDGLASFMLEVDWSPWLICRSCRAQFL